MKKTPMKFWASCPHCKKKFGVEPKFITMYLKRVIENYKDRFKSVHEMLEGAQKEVEENKKRGS
jgi:hypothetical protein